MEPLDEPTDSIEVHAFSTTTLTTTQLLSGMTEGIPETIGGVLSRPFESDPPFPTVIVLHGAGGTEGNAIRWTSHLNRIGVATFVIDSYTGRGIPLRQSYDYVDGRGMIVDAYQGLAYLAQHPPIDATRIAVMGFSKGGAAALYSSLKRFQRQLAPAGLEFAAHIAFYPPCWITFRHDEEVTDRPIRLLHGTADDWTPITPCQEYISRLQQRGKDAQLLAFAGTPHGFDMPWAQEHFTAYNGLGTCRLIEREDGKVVNLDTGRPWQPTDAGVTEGVTEGADPYAYAEVVQAITAFLTDTFQLNILGR